MSDHFDDEDEDAMAAIDDVERKAAPADILVSEPCGYGRPGAMFKGTPRKRISD